MFSVRLQIVYGVMYMFQYLTTFPHFSTTRFISFPESMLFPADLRLAHTLVFRIGCLCSSAALTDQFA
jgi:hypothetical protein